MKYSSLSAYRYLKAFLSMKDEGLTIGQKMLFLLIMALFEQKDVLTVYEVKQANLPTKISTTETNFSALKAKGYFTTQRSGQFFSRAYITPTNKAFLLLRSFRSLVASLG